MLRAVLRDMRAHPGRIAMTMVAIVLGVAFVVATWVVSDSAAATVSAGSSRSDLAAQVLPDRYDQRLTAQDRDRLVALPGVSGAIGVVNGHTGLVKADGKLGNTYYAAEGGTSWDSSDRFKLLSGRGPAAAGEVALEEEAATDAGLRTGSTARLLAKDGTISTAKVVGVFVYRKAGVDEVNPAVAYDPATAWTAFGGKGFDRVDLFGADPAAIAAAARTALGESVTVKTRADLAAEREREANQQATFVRNFLLAFAGVAVMAGMFVIANTFTMLVAQRTRHFALLRAVGARRGQVRRAVLTEAAVLGLIGATIGAVIGVGLGAAAMALLRSTGEAVVFKVSPLAIIVGYLVGVIVTVVAAYGSARRGAAVPPVAALGTDAALPRRSLLIRTVAGSAALGAGMIAVVATAGSNLTDMKRVVGMGGALLGWFAVILLAPLLASAVLIPLARLVTKRGSAVSRIAVRNSIRDPRRTAATASALMIGLALVTAFATVGESLTSYFTSVIKAEVPANTLIVQSVVRWEGMPSGISDQIRQVPGVSHVATPIGVYGSVTHNGKTTEAPLTTLEPDAIGTAITPRIIAGQADLTGGVLVSEDLVTRLGINVGDTLTATAQPDRPGAEVVTAKVTGIYGSSELLRGVVVSRSALPSVTNGYQGGIYVTGADQTALRKALDAAFADRPDITVLDRQQLIAQVTEPLELALGIIYALLAAAVLIAVFGVVNTLALSVLERTREIGVFRAVGATRSLVKRSVRLESIIIAGYGGLLGVVVGLLLGGVMQHMIIGAPIFDLAVPTTMVAGALGGMVVVGVLAALWPARRAARTNVLEAIATS